MNDAELLQDFAERGSESAFRALVDRHLPLVFGTARRVTGNGTLAEEIAQTVFLLLARKARNFNPEAVLTGWLFRTTRFVSARAMRTEQRRRRYEEAAAMHLQSNLDPLWPRVAPQLDDALACLNESDRHAILLRFFDQCGRRDLAEALGVSEEAAKKRVTRALDRLRRILSRRGFDLSAAALMGGLAHEVASAAVPAGLNGQIGSIVIAKLAAGGPAGISGTALLADVLAAMRWAKIKLALGVGAGVLLAVLGISSALRERRTTTVAASPAGAVVRVAPASSIAAVKRAVPLDLDDTFEINGEKFPRRTLRLKVLDAIGGDPIPGAAVMHVFLIRPNETLTPEPLRTDQQGIAEVQFPERFPNDPLFNQFSVSVRADGYAPREVMWLSTTGGVLRTVSSEYTLRLETGITIGASVLDDAGQPLSGVAVGLVANNYRGYSVSYSEGHVVSPPEVRVDEISNFRLAANPNALDSVVTDQSGRFQIPHFPGDLAALQLELVTPDGTRHAFRTPQGSRLSSEALPEIAFPELKAGTARIVLPHGVTVDGMVVDAEGHAVPGANVVEGVMIGNWRELSRSVADTEGRFRLVNRLPREVVLSAAAIGHASASAIVKIAPRMAPIRLQLPPEQPLRGRVTAEDGARLAGARVALVDFPNDGLGMTWNDTTDGDGRFVWRGAPTNEVVVSATATGYSIRTARLKPSATEHVITLRAGVSDTVRVTGRVTDAVTGESVEHFSVKVHVGLSGSLPEFLKRTAEGQKGKFETEVRMSDFQPHTGHAWVLLVEADNYEPLVTRSFDPNEGDQNLDLKLKPGGNVDGTVQTPEGAPAADARLAFAQEGDPVLATRDGEFSQQRSEKSPQWSDTSGRFQLIKPPKSTALVVFHDSGWAIVPIQPGAQKLRIQLQAWAKVEGVLIRKGAPAPDEQIGLSSLGLDECLALQVLSSATTDAQGQFAFRMVPAGEYSLSHRPKNAFMPGRNASVLETLQTTVSVTSGETRSVTLGGSGRSVVARLQTPPTVPAMGWTHVLAVLRRDVPVLNEPSPAQYATFASLNTAVRNRSRDPAYLAARREERTYFGATQPDGTKTFDDVAPGRYVLDVKHFEPAMANRNAFGDAPVKARLRLAVNVPETSSPSDEPLDLGRVTLEPMQ